MSESAEYLTTARYAFHSTPRQNAASVRSDGVQCDRETGHDTTTISRVLRELGYDDPFPFDRGAAAYCYVDGEYVADVMEDMGESPFASDDVYLVVDITEIDAPMYVASMSVITDLIDYDMAGGHAMMYADTPHEVVERYRETISRVNAPSDVANYESARDGCIELVVDGDIPPSAIVDVLES